MSDPIESFLEVEDVVKELLLVFQILLNQQPQVEYLF